MKGESAIKITDANFVAGAPKEKFVKTYYARWFVKMRVLYELIRDNPNFEKVLWSPIYDKCGELYSWGMIVFREDGSAIKITNRECIKIFDNLFDCMDYKLLMGKIQGE